MKAMSKNRSYSVEFKRQVAQEFIAGETLHGLSKRHDISRQLIRVCVQKYEAGALDEDAQAADLIHEYEAKIAALERMVGRQALEIEFLKGGSEKRTATEKRDYIGNCRPPGISIAEGCRLMGLSRFYLLRHARDPRERGDHRCGDEKICAITIIQLCESHEEPDARWP